MPGLRAVRQPAVRVDGERHAWSAPRADVVRGSPFRGTAVNLGCGARRSPCAPAESRAAPPRRPGRRFRARCLPAPGKRRPQPPAWTKRSPALDQLEAIASAPSPSESSAARTSQRRSPCPLGCAPSLADDPLAGDHASSTRRHRPRAARPPGPRNGRAAVDELRPHRAPGEVPGQPAGGPPGSGIAAPAPAPRLSCVPPTARPRSPRLRPPPLCPVPLPGRPWPSPPPPGLGPVWTSRGLRGLRWASAGRPRPGVSRAGPRGETSRCRVGLNPG